MLAGLPSSAVWQTVNKNELQGAANWRKIF